MVTKGWAEKRIDDVTRIIDSLHQTPKFSPSGIPMVRVADIKGGKLDTSNTAMVTYEIYEKFTKNYKPQKGDILFSRVGSYGNSSYVASEEPFCLGQNTVVINPTCVDGLFLYYSLQSEKLKRQIDTEVDGSSHKTISLKVIKDLRVLVPPSPEQKKIARILSTWDAAIETVEKLIENSRRQKKGLMQQLLAGKKRLPGFSGEWKNKDLEELASIIMGASPKSSAYNEARQGLPLLQGNADIHNRRSSPRMYTSQITKKCEIGDVLISVRAPVGAVAISEHKACIGRGLAAIRAKSSASQSFVFQVMLDLENKWASYSQGSTFEAINSKELAHMNISVPPTRQEQEAIAQILANNDAVTNIIYSHLDNLNKQKQALMQQLLTGKRRVKVDE